MLGLAGLPLTSGFVSKFILITNLWSYEKYILVFALMLWTVAGFYFYLKPIWIAAIDKPENSVPPIQLKLNDKIVDKIKKMKESRDYDDDRTGRVAPR